MVENQSSKEQFESNFKKGREVHCRNVWCEVGKSKLKVNYDVVMKKKMLNKVHEM